MTPARAELALIIREIAAVEAQRDEARRLLDQWQGPESEMATVELQLASFGHSVTATEPRGARQAASAILPRIPRIW